MGRYIVRRCLQAVVTLLLVVLALHLLTTLAIQLNGNPAEAFFGDRIPTAAQLAAVERRYGLDDPCYDQPGNPCLGPLLDRLGDYATGDFGTNLRGRDVTDIVFTAAPNTLRLFAIVTVTWFTLGMVLGTIAARWRGKAADHGIRLTSVLIDAFPVFVLLLVYRYVVSVPLSKWAARNFGSESFVALLVRPSFDADHPWLTLLVPGVLLGLAGSAAFVRLVRASQLESYTGDHVRTARAKGLPERHVVTHHVIRNSSVPVVTAVGLTFADALGGAVITESVFEWNGMGRMFTGALAAFDPNPVMAFVLITAASAIIFNLIADLLYAVLDPRIRIT